MENRNINQLEYDAFISYRHCDLDQFVATRLHKKLESFKLPRSVLKLVPNGKQKINRVFRDEDELPLSDNLSDPIDNALSHTDFLIVICTPRLSASRWCLREIETFLQKHDRKHVLLVLAEGEPDESFPEILTYEEVKTVAADGRETVERRPLEPLAADVRGKTHKEILKAMDTAVIKLAAAMFSLNFDDLKQRHREQRVKRLVTVWGSISAAVLIFAIVCLIMLAKIRHQNAVISDKYAGTMAMSAGELLGQGRRQDAIYAVRSVLPDKGKYNSEAYRMLASAVNPYATGLSYVSEGVFEIPSRIRDYKLSGNGEYMAVLGNHNDYHIFDTNSGKELFSRQENLPYQMDTTYGFDGTTGFIFSTEEEVRYITLQDQEENIISDTKGFVFADGHSDTTVILTEGRLLGYCEGACIFETKLADYGITLGDCYDYGFGYSEDGKYLSFVAMEDVTTLAVLLDTKTGSIETGVRIATNGQCDVATNGSFLYVLETDYDSDVSSIHVVDSYYADILGTLTLDMNFAHEIFMLQGSVVVMSNDRAMVFDPYTMNLQAQLDEANVLLDTFAYEDMIMLVDKDGHCFALGEGYPYGQDYTDLLFDYDLEKDVLQCRYGGEAFYFHGTNSNFIVKYVQNPLASQKETDLENLAYEEECQGFEDAESEIASLMDPELEKQYVYAAIYSSDRKLIAVMMCDQTLRLYDATTKELLKVLYGVGNVTMNSLVYIEENQVYVLNASPYAYILNQDLQYISKMNYCVGCRDGVFVVVDMAVLYEVPFVSYEEMLKLADDIIEGHKVSNVIAEKYGILD